MLIQLNILQYMSAADKLQNFIGLCLFLILAFLCCTRMHYYYEKECSYVHISKIYSQKEVFENQLHSNLKITMFQSLGNNSALLSRHVNNEFWRFQAVLTVLEGSGDLRQSCELTKGACPHTLCSRIFSLITTSCLTGL